MLDRRRFVAAAVAALAAPAVLRFGRTANAADRRVRRKLSTLTPADPFFSKYADAVAAMHALPENDPRSWRSQGIIHADKCMHQTREFTTWHRAYLHCFEAICADLLGDANFALPYWNWTDASGRLPASFFAGDALDVVHWNDPSNYYGQMWGQIETTPTRAATASFGLLDDPDFAGDFAPHKMAEITRQRRFANFSGLLEGPHGSVHVSIGRGGHMGSGLSPLDPIFWLHHCNVDRIWAEWQAADNQVTGVDLDKAYTDFVCGGTGVHSITIRETLDFRGMGYTYDSLAVAPELSEEIRQLQLQAQMARTITTEAGAEGGEKVIGRAKGTAPSFANIATVIETPTEGLVDALFRPRQFNEFGELGIPRTAVEPGRVLASLQGVVPTKAAAQSIGKVFVNCPYLSSSTPTTDQHFAGNISFFSCPPGFCQSGSFLIDVTEPLRSQAEQGRLMPGSVNVQIMPADLAEAAGDEALFEVGEVVLFSA